MSDEYTFQESIIKAASEVAVYPKIINKIACIDYLENMKRKRVYAVVLTTPSNSTDDYISWHVEYVSDLSPHVLMRLREAAAIFVRELFGLSKDLTESGIHSDQNSIFVRSSLSMFSRKSNDT